MARHVLFIVFGGMLGCLAGLLAPVVFIGA